MIHSTLTWTVLLLGIGQSLVAEEKLRPQAADTTPPIIVSTVPAAGTVTELKSITVTFSEPVTGVAAPDFLVNNQQAEAVTGSGATYTFTFVQPAYGLVDITWDAGHQIADLAVPPNKFNETSGAWQYLLQDEIAPVLASTVPPPGATTPGLTQIELKFSEPVGGVDASDLLINGVVARSVQTRSEDTYVFEFTGQSPGTVNISWSANHQIMDISSNAFAGTGWSYVIDPQTPLAQVVITEFLASPENITTNLKDEDNMIQDWIELFNRGTTAVNLAGWSLTDDPDEPALWTFPDVTLEAGTRLVVFASGKDRKPTQAGARLHTSFRLNVASEYLALFNANSPRVAMTEFRGGYPVQRNDYSYGVDTDGLWRYFQTRTPGQANGATTIIGVAPAPEVNVKRGLFDGPFTLTLTGTLPQSFMRYTTNGSQPTASSGLIYTTPLQITGTTVLRAGVFRTNDYLPSDIITHTYIFPDQVLTQPTNPPGYPPTWGTHTTGFPNNIVPADYGMDPEIVTNQLYSGIIKDSLLALPIISIAVKIDDMFHPTTGIYTHPLSRGPQWERPISIEFMPLDGNGFQENAGIQIQGNAAREPQKQPKHPMRVTFKGDYGAKRLTYQMFPDSPIENFDTLILRADFNTSWLHWNSVQRVRGQRTRDAWMKDSMRAMGGLASHNRYVHLYINGLYWGIYEPAERPDGSFGEAYLGGQKEDYDVMNEGAPVDGTMTAYTRLVSFTGPSLANITNYNNIKKDLDMTQFIDYMLLHFYTGHEDWFMNKNWYAIRPRDGSRGFLYTPWDGELILGDTNRNVVTLTDLPSGLHPKLLSSFQYRMDFADRVHKHFFNRGALTPELNTNRWMKRAREIELPIIAESARWGDYRRDVHRFDLNTGPVALYTRENQWRAEQRRLLTNYFPNRTRIVLAQLRNANLYPRLVDAPSFSQHGGKIDPAFQMQISAPTGTVYYTTSGIDPRVYGTGAVSTQALTYTTPIKLNGTVQVKSRALAGTNWSALNEATFTTDGPRFPLRITEVMYNPNPPGDAFEYIELQNLGSLPLEVSFHYLEGVDYIFPVGTVLAPGQIILLGSADNPATFGQRYPGVTVFGRFGGQLANGGERIALVSPTGLTLLSVDYNDENGWPEEPDGKGFSLEIRDPLSDPDDAANWQASAAAGGSPGAPNSSRAPGVIINEVLASASDGPDWVELLNNGATIVNLGGWTLSQRGNTNSFIFPQGTTVAPGAFVSVFCDKLVTGAGFHAPFALDAEGETLILRNATGIIADVLTFGPQVRDYSLGLVSARFDLNNPSPGRENVAASRGHSESLIINEWLANAAPGESDWIEIHNTAALPVPLRGLFLSIPNQLFEITSHSFVAGGGFVQLFADENAGSDHLDFKLPAAGTTLELLDTAGLAIDSVTFNTQAEGISQGRFPDGTDNIVSFPISASPGSANSLGFPIAVTVSSTEIELSWPSRIGGQYRAESSQDLATWSPFMTVTAADATTRIKDSLQLSRRYYRIVALP